MSFVSEFYQYFNARTVVLPNSNGCNKMFYSVDMGFFPINCNFNDYFANCIKSPERALIRKAIKNGYVCKEIDYDDYLDDIYQINISKSSRQGELMSQDYIGLLKPRTKIVGAIGQEIHSYGCFNSEGKLVAYYMYELFGKEILHTVKGIGHSDHLKYGVMNFLFAFSVDKLYSSFPDGKHIISYGGMTPNEGGLSRFKRNIGCQLGCLAIKGSKDFYKDLKAFNKKYKLHGDTGLNFVLDYVNQ